MQNRVYLTEFTADDFDKFHKVVSNKDVMRYALWNLHSEADVQRHFDEFISVPRFHHYGIYLTGSDAFIGMGVLLEDYKSGGGEIGYFLLPEFWGQGYGLETAQIICDKCFNELKLHKALATCNADNLASEKIMKKLGMKREGVLRQARRKGGSWCDEYFYGILRDEWLA